MAGRGILMAAGGAVPLTNTYIALHMLRNVHNCTLPVQIYYNGTGELDTGTRLFFEVYLRLQQYLLCAKRYILLSSGIQDMAGVMGS